MKSNSKGVSLVLFTRNEEKNIKDCILSAKTIVDEIILIDMSSEDKTEEIAKRLGANVIRIPNKGFVDEHLNFGYSKAAYPWILTISADERINPYLARKLQKIVKKDKCDVVLAPRKNIRFKKWIKHGGWWPDNQPLLFRKGFVNLPEKINQAHVKFIIKGRQLILDKNEKNAIVHYNVENLKHMLSKLAWYYTQEGAGDYFDDIKVTPQILVNSFKGEFRYRYIEKKGYLDGIRGYTNAKFREYAKFLEFVNWWERKGYPEIFSRKNLLEIVSANEELSGLDHNRSFGIHKSREVYGKLKSKAFRLIKLISGQD